MKNEMPTRDELREFTHEMILTMCDMEMWNLAEYKMAIFDKLKAIRRHMAKKKKKKIPGY